MLARLQGTAVQATARFSGSGRARGRRWQRQPGSASSEPSKYRGARGLDPAFIQELERQFGFDKPAHERFLLMMGRYLRFDFGKSFFRSRSVIDLVHRQDAGVDLAGSVDDATAYLISIPLGIAKAVRDGSRFDVWTSAVVIVGNAIPGFLFAILLIVVFAGGRYFAWFPLARAGVGQLRRPRHLAEKSSTTPGT